MANGNSLAWRRDELQAEFVRLTDQIQQNPYNTTAWQARGQFLMQADYHDLAASDYYKALLLTDEALDGSGEYHRRALAALDPSLDEDDEDDEEDLPVDVVTSVRAHALVCYEELVACLLELGCLRSAYQFCQRGLSTYPNESQLLADSNETILERHRETNPQGSSSEAELLEDLSEKGLARRELYPWDSHEPDRYTEDSINLLNQRLAAVAPQCIVKVVDLPVLHHTTSTSNPAQDAKMDTVKQLGVFARSQIVPGTVVLREKSLLAVNNRLHDELCDACSAELPSDLSQAQACPECSTAIFCSADCLQQAQEAYHPVICGNDDFEVINKDVKPLEATDALYGLLLGRAITMAETQDVHPLELAETQFLWGDYSIWEAPTKLNGRRKKRPRTLPFSFHQNIDNPIHILTVLDVDIFATVDRYDAWILNTLFAKFRGVANARMNAKTGRPEVAAVHALWCLANHSCAPNVTWQWGGEIKMWVRDGAKGEVVKWGPKKAAGAEESQGGLKAGEELLNHYCDVNLPVKERREWAAGALGGICMCERCVWEAEYEEKASN